MGKSELVNAIAAHIIKEHDKPVYMIKPEEALGKSYKLLLGKIAGRIFHDPNIPFDYDAFDQADELVGDKAMFQDIYQFGRWDDLKEDIMYAVVNDGVQDVFIDPITCFTNTMNSAEANEHLTRIAAELSAMAKDMDFTAYIFCHLKAPEGTPHEMGAPVFSNQFAGSRAMMRSCNYMIGLEGNKDPELPLEQRNMRYLKILEDREFGVSTTIPLYWDYKTGLFNESRSYE
jgi:twinkle protein